MNEAGEKTEQATPQKLRDAQQKGMSLRSPELSTLASLSLAALMLLLLVPHAADEFAAITRSWIAAAPGTNAASAQALAVLGTPGAHLLVVLFAASLSIACIAAAAYGGVRFSGFPLRPDFSRLNPAKGFKRIFSKHTLAETAKTTLKIALAVMIVFLLGRDALVELVAAPVPSAGGAARWLLDLAIRAVAWLIALQLLFAVYDLWYARRRYLQQLRMSRSEVKDEYKRQEGDPDIKRKRKRIYSSLMAQLRALGNVKDADVVITNPTHVAVALKYVPGRMDAPAIACAGRGSVAAIIRSLARRHRVPLVRQPALARALITDHEIGETIDRRHQGPVVHIYRWLLARPGSRGLAQ